MAGRGYAADVARRDDARVTSGLRAMLGGFIGAARPAVVRLMMVLALVASVLAVSAPAQAAGESYSGSGTNIYRRYAGDYLISSSIAVLYTGNSQVYEEAASYVAFNIPANKFYSAVNLSHAHSCNYGAGVQINFSLLTRQPASNGVGITEIRASARFGGVIARSGASVDSLPSSVVTEMNRLSAAGGGTLYLGVHAGTSASVLCGFNTFNLVGETTSPAIWSVTPNRGPAAGNNTVTIVGNYLDRATSVTFGGAAGTNISASANEITVTAPAGSPGAVDVVVTTPGGTATASSAYTYIVGPSISSVSPNTGPTSGSYAVTINGNNLINATDVTFGGVPGAITSRRPNSLEVSVPALYTARTVDVVVTGPGGTATLVNGFTAVDAPTISTVSPNRGPLAGTNAVLVSGTNLAGAGVTFGGIPATNVSATATTITANVPAHAAGAVNVVVTTPGGTATATNGYTYAAAPAANAFTAAAVGYNSGSAPTSPIELSAHTSGVASDYYLYNGSGGAGLITTAQGGRASVNIATGHVDYTPPVGFRGADTFQYSAGNGGMSGWATVTVPVSDPVFTVTLPQTTGQVGVDYNPSNTPVTITGGTGPYTITQVTGYPRGMDSNSSSQTLSGRPSEAGNWTVNFTIRDSSRGTGAYTSTVSAVLVTENPPAPTADSFTAPAVAYNTGSASPAAIDLTPHTSGVILSYYLNVGGAPRTSATTAQGGSVTIEYRTGQVSYTPPVGFRGSDTFQYRPSNSQATAPWATVTVPVNDPVFTVTLPQTTGQVGVDYNPSNTPVAISGGRAPYTVTAVTGYPRALTFDASAQVLSGVVREDGTWPVIFTITDSSAGAGGYSSTASATLVTTFPARPVAASFNAPAVAYNTGSASPTIIDLAPHGSGVVEGYSLRDGIYVSFSVTTAQGGTAVLDPGATQVRYTPPVGFRGNDSFSYASENAGGSSITATVTIPVSDPVFTVTLPEASGAAGAPYNSGGAAVTVSGGAAPYSNFAANGLPAGLTMNGAGVISGTPATSFNGAVGITFTDDSTGQGPFSASATVPLNIVGPTLTVAPTSGGLPGARLHSAYSQTFIPGGGTPPYRFELLDGDLPNGLALSTVGVLSGTPTRTGTFNFTLRLRDSTGGGDWATDRTYSLEVGLPLPPTAEAMTTTVAANSSGNLITPRLSGAPTDSVAVAGGPTHGAVTVSGLTFLYTPTAGYSGVDSFTYVAANAGGESTPASATITVEPPVLTLSNLAPATGVATTPYSAALTASLGAAPYSYVVSGGALPTGLSLSTGGALSGTPTVSGGFTFEVTATDAYGAVGTRTYTLDLSAPTIAMTPAAGAMPGGLRTVAYGQTLTAAGGAGPYAYGLTDGALPTGLTLAADGTLSGTPTTAGRYGFTVTATDAFGFIGAAAYTLEIGTPVPVVQAQTATVVGGQSVTIDVTQGATGLDFASVSVAAAPSHGTATVQSMSIVYTAEGAYAGPDSFTYTVNNAGGPSAPGTVTITVNPAVATGPEKTAAILAGRTATVELTDGATGSPFTGAAVVSMGPTGAGTATIAPRTGQGGVQLYDLVFTPADAFTGEATVLYTLSNAFTTSTPGTVTITVEARPDPGLDPEVRGVATSQVTAARRFADAQINNFQRRLQVLRDGTNGSSNGLSLNLGFGGGDEDRDPRTALRRDLGQDSSRVDPGALNDGRDREMMGLDLWADRPRIAPAGASPVTGDRLNALPSARTDGGGHPVGFWTAGSVDWGRHDADGQRDYRFTTQGVTAGLDVRINDSLIIGGGLGYGEDRTKIGDNGSLTEGSALTGALYASWRPAEAFYIDGVLGYADLDFSSHRWVQGLDDQPSGYVDGDRSGQVLFASAAFGRVIRREGLISDLYARLDARELTLDAFTETGGDLAALSWDALGQSSLSANLGASLRWNIETRRFGRFMPSARLEWSHELEAIGNQGVRYADWAGSPTYIVPLDAWSRDALNLDLGLEWSMTDRLMVSLGFRALHGDASSSQGGQIGLKYGW